MKTKLIALSALFLAQAAVSRADIIVVAPTASTFGSFEITHDITFTITTASINAPRIVFDDWVPLPVAPTQTPSNLSPNISLSFNGGTPFTGYGQLYGTYAGLPSYDADVTPNDGILHFPSLGFLSAGDTLTLKAGLYHLYLSESFDSRVTQTFTGNVFLVGADMVRASSIESAAIPEPSAAALLLGGVASACVVARRRIRKS